MGDTGGLMDSEVVEDGSEEGADYVIDTEQIVDNAMARFTQR